MAVFAQDALALGAEAFDRGLTSLVEVVGVPHDPDRSEVIEGTTQQEQLRLGVNGGAPALLAEPGVADRDGPGFGIDVIKRRQSGEFVGMLVDLSPSHKIGVVEITGDDGPGGGEGMRALETHPLEYLVVIDRGENPRGVVSVQLDELHLIAGQVGSFMPLTLEDRHNANLPNWSPPP